MANKRIALKDMKPGIKVVCGEAPDAQVYTVETVQGLGVELSYLLDDKAKTKASGGWTDYSICRVPTKQQLAASA